MIPHMYLRPLTDSELAALRAFAREYGHGWKAVLLRLWHTASASPTLHCLRNSHGPAWLAALAIAQPARIVSGGRVVVERGCKAIGWRKGMRLSVLTAEPGLVVLRDETWAPRTITFSHEGVGDITALVTKLRDSIVAIEVRAIGCEAPREDR